MQRVPSPPRADWPARVESQGLHFHTLDGEPYWDESVYYAFSRAEIDELERATQTLDRLCLEAVQHVIDSERWEAFGIAPPFADFISASWESDELTVYGRFDFAFDGRGPPKLLEYNADTPTALLEAASIQWFWLKDVHPRADQFNSIHERLLEFWPRLGSPAEGPIHFLSQGGHLEDFMTVTYLADTAQQAGYDVVYLEIEQVGWNAARRLFVDLDERPIRRAFKLYPWEWMMREAFGTHLPECRVLWLEPPWKALLSNKAILAILWELFPECPYLLPAHFEPQGDSYVIKPVQGREGANVQWVQNGQVVAATDGPYGDEPVVYQAVRSLPCFDGRYPVLGCWIVNGYACGLGIREDTSPITQNTSRFVPHIFAA